MAKIFTLYYRINITEADESMNDTAIEETTMIPAENYNKLVNIMEEMVEKLKVYLFNLQFQPSFTWSNFAIFQNFKKNPYQKLVVQNSII